VYRNKAHRDAVNKKVFADPRMANMSAVDMPVDMARMATAGFKTLVEASAGSATGRRRAAPRRSNGARPRTPVSRPEVVWSR
jgi:hypothetical protein